MGRPHSARATPEIWEGSLGTVVAGRARGTTRRTAYDYRAVQFLRVDSPGGESRGSHNRRGSGRLPFARFDQKMPVGSQPFRGLRNHPPVEVQSVGATVERGARLVVSGLRRHGLERTTGHIRSVHGQEPNTPADLGRQRQIQVALINLPAYISDVPASTANCNRVNIRGVEFHAGHAGSNRDPNRP